jgi:hypothetical protein
MSQCCSRASSNRVRSQGGILASRMSPLPVCLVCTMHTLASSGEGCFLSALYRQWVRSPSPLFLLTTRKVTSRQKSSGSVDAWNLSIACKLLPPTIVLAVHSSTRGVCELGRAHVLTLYASFCVPGTFLCATPTIMRISHSGSM